MAGRIPEDFINEVRSNVNIVDVISQYVSLEKKGKDYLGLCPFHQEKTPSFTVNEEKQFFKCFGCGKGGNVFKFLMDKENLTFPESVASVAEFAHIPMPATYGKGAPISNPLIKLHEEVAEFYHRVLLTTEVGVRGLSYANSRQLDKEIIEHFKIGYAPKQDNILYTYLHDKGYEDATLAESGLFVENKDGRLFDRFRDRLMFPLDDENGHIIGFSGRRISEDATQAKYMNSPETKIFTKSKVLFHFAEAKKAARAEQHLILYEGYMDVIAAYKAGIKSGIASMGTSLTDQQIYLLRRITSNIIINYDGDDPGIHAEERAVDMFQRVGGFNLGVVVLPEKLDPDEYVKKYGVAKYQEEVAAALSPTDFFLRRLQQKYNLHNDREKLQYLDEAIKKIATLTNPMEQDIFIKKVSEEQGVSLDSLKASLMREIRRLKQVRRHTEQAYDLSEEPSPVTTETELSKQNDPALDRLLYLFINFEEARDFLLQQKFLFPNQKYAQLAELWLKYISTHENPTTNSFLDFIPEELQGIIVNTEMTEMPAEFSEREILQTIHIINLRKIDSQLKELQSKIQDAQRKQDASEILQITQKILELKRAQGQKEAF